jgi:hypothetical protein
MPHLADPHAQLAHLRDAVNGKDRWVLVTNLDAGHLLQLVLGAGLIVSGVADADLGYGILRCLDKPTGRQTTVSFLTVPKKALPRRRLRRALRGFGLSVGRSKGDLVIIAGSGADSQLLARLLTSVATGEASWLSGEGN